MEKIRICFIISNLGQGGAERQFVELIKYIDKKRFDCTLCLYAVQQELFYKETRSISDLHLTEHSLRSKIKFLKILEAMWFIRKYLAKGRFDIVQTTLSMNGVLVRLAADRKYHGKMVSTVRTAFSAYPLYLLLLEKALLRRSYVITNTRKSAVQFKEYCRCLHSERIQCIYNGFDNARFYQKNPALSDRSVIIGTIGRITREKNQFQLVKLAKEMSGDVSFIFQGHKGDSYNAIAAYIKEQGIQNVSILEKSLEISETYQGIDIFVLPSLFEGCPNVLFEAMLSGCICVVSPGANSDGFITDGVNGFIYDGSDSDLKLKVLRAMNIVKSPKAETIRTQARKYVEDIFSMEKMVRSYEILYMSMLGQPYFSA
jgi:glycosyltransferase involved in cell wall biosynthesis